MNITEDQQRIRRATLLYRDAIPITGTPGAEYLKGRGITTSLAHENRVRYHAKFPVGKAVAPAVVFPIFPGDRGKELVAVNARFLNPERDAGGENQRSAGKLSWGVFGTNGAVDNPEAVVAEAPIDALSLAAAGIPAFATCGAANLRDFPELYGGKTVVCAFDMDSNPITQFKVRDAMARLKDKHDGRVVWLKPPGGALKDWNDVLQKYGVQGLAQYLRQAGAKCRPAILSQSNAGDVADLDTAAKQSTEAETVADSPAEVSQQTQETLVPAKPLLTPERIEARARAAEAYQREVEAFLREQGIDPSDAPPQSPCRTCGINEWRKHPEKSSVWICVKCGAGVMII